MKNIINRLIYSKYGVIWIMISIYVFIVFINFLPFLFGKRRVLFEILSEGKDKPMNNFDVFMGFILGVLITAGIALWESSRFRHELEQARDQDTRVRMPFSRRSITLEEFRRMWGSNYPERWKRQEEGDSE